MLINLSWENQNIEHLEGNDSFKFYEMELADQKNVDKLFSENTIDVVYHMAANSDIQKGGKEPSIDFNDTLLTTRTLLGRNEKSKGEEFCSLLLHLLYRVRCWCSA